MKSPAFAVLTGLLLAGCGRPRADYMPLAVGNRWNYRVVREGGRASSRRLEITSRVSEVSYRAQEGGAPQLISKEDGFLSVLRQGQMVYLLILPPTKGIGWWTTTPQGKLWCRVAGRETVSVPAGVFAGCVVVVMEAKGGSAEIRHWFAPGVGWVRYSWGPRGGRPWEVRELVDYELHPPGSAEAPAPD